MNIVKEYVTLFLFAIIVDFTNKIRSFQKEELDSAENVFVKLEH
jgi:hypothetical protein